MSETTGRTRAQLIASVLMNLGAARLITASGNGSVSTFKFALGLASASDFIGYYLQFLTGANSSGYRMVTASSTPSSGIVTLTFAPDATSTTTNDTAVLTGWQGAGVSPEMVAEFLNQAIMEVVGLYWDPVESVAFHTGRETYRFDVASTMTTIKDVWYRGKMTWVQIHDANSAWDEQAVLSGVTGSLDTEDYRQGGGSVRFVFTAGATTGVVASKAISSLDLRKYTHVEFWAKSTVTTAAGDLRILLDDTASVASVIENLQVPALTANTWTYCRVALDTPELDSAIISVGLRHQVDLGACTVWLDDVKAVQADSAVWVKLNPGTWHLDREARDLVLTGSLQPPYALLKLEGGDKPTLLTADSTVTEVPESYLIARATALMLLSGIGSPSMDASTRGKLADYWTRQAELRRLTAIGRQSGRSVE